MAKIEVLDNNKKKVGDVELPELGPVKKQLLWEVVRQQQASVRAGTASTKKRGDVSGGGKKPWRQKHTGNARHGSIREPQWRHGGNVFGPMPRDYSYDVPKKVAKAALKSAVAQRQKEQRLLILDKLDLSKPSTKTAAKTLANLGVAEEGALVVIAARDLNIEKSFRNIPRVKVLAVEGLNVRDILKYRNLVITKGAVEGVSKRVAA